MPGTWSGVEVLWTALSLLMLPFALYALREAVLDLRAAVRDGRDRAHAVAAWWWLNTAVRDVLLFGGFAAVGLVAGQLPDRPITLGEREVVAGHVSAGVFLAIEAVASASLLHGLWARRRVLGLRAEPGG